MYFVIALPPSEEGVIFGADYDTREDAKSFIRVFLRNVAEATSNAKERTTWSEHPDSNRDPCGTDFKSGASTCFAMLR